MNKSQSLNLKQMQDRIDYMKKREKLLRGEYFEIIAKPDDGPMVWGDGEKNTKCHAISIMRESLRQSIRELEKGIKEINEPNKEYLF